MKTAVEWLQMKMATSSAEEMVGNINTWFKQAKKMEKEQIVEHSVKLTKILISNPFKTRGKTPKELVDNYFKETFKQ
jgi:hypothetical protein